MSWLPLIEMWLYALFMQLCFLYVRQFPSAAGYLCVRACCVFVFVFTSSLVHVVLGVVGADRPVVLCLVVLLKLCSQCPIVIAPSNACASHISR